MKVEIDWKEVGNTQTKTFKEEMDCVAWCRKNCENIMAINGILTYRKKLNHFDIIGCIRGREIGLTPFDITLPK